MEKADWEKLEILVTKIQKSLAPDAIVEHNVHMPGLQSERSRQVDVLVTQKIGQYQMKIVIDCKDYKTPVDVKGVEEFAGLLEDVGANKGSIVCPKGFTETAKRRASKLQIDLYSPVDTDPHKWQVKVAAPVICKSRDVQVAFGITQSDPVPFQIALDFYQSSIIFDENGKELGTPLAIFRSQWNAGKYPMDAGIHERVALLKEKKCFMDNGYGAITSVGLYLSLHVLEERYFGHTPISQISGLKDEQTGLIHTKEFTTKVVTPEEIVKTWKKLGPEDELPTKPLFELVMLEYFHL